MRTTQAARYARWSALMALLLAAGVGAVYAHRLWQERLERRSTPAKVPASVEDQASGFSFSKVNGDKTLFTVRASRATEFRGGGGDRLDDVWITMYGPNGTRSDNMHTQACDYTEATQTIVCAGAVKIDLASASAMNPQSATAKAPQAENPNSGAADPSANIHVQTSHVSFNRQTGLATTDQPVEVHFPQGDGQAVGALYDSVQGQWSLEHDVKLTLRSFPATGEPHTSKEQPVDVSAASLSYTDDNMMHLAGPVEVRGSDSDLTAGKLDIALDQEFHARRVVASGHPILRGGPHIGALVAPASIRADQFVGSLAAGGWLESAAATGNVHAEDRAASRESSLDAGRADVTFAGNGSHPQKLTASDHVVAESKSTTGPDSSAGRLATSSLTIEFTPQGNTARIERATTPAATLDWQGGTRGTPGATMPQRLHMTSQQLEAKFNSSRTPASLTELRGSGGVWIERQIGESQLETSTSREALGHFDAGGSWSSVDQTGDVRLQQGQQNARGDRAHFDRASDDLALAGSVEIADASSRTTSKTADLREAANEIRADGSVVTTELSAAGKPGATLNLGDGPAHILADHLQVNTSTSRAVYSGHARLWQGDALVQSDRMEIDQPTQVLTATGQVRATFLQTPWTGPPGGAAPAKPSGQLEYWRANAGRLTYASRDGRGHLEDHVLAKSDQGIMHADAMDLLFGAPAVSPGTKIVDSRQLTHATGFGNVQVEQGERRGASSRADYDAALGKFDLSGGSPMVHDASGNSTTGRELTFFFADDTITVDSEEGSRTLTLHRVEK